MKKLVLAFILILSAVLAFSSCETSEKACEHSFSEWSVITEASCDKDGEKEAVCELCGEKKTEKIDMLGHDYKDTVVEPTKSDDGYTEHTCSRCGDTYIDSTVPAIGSEGLAYEVAEEKTCVITGIGTCTDTDIVIPQTIEGFTVVGIKSRAFMNSATIVSVKIPVTVVSVGASAFSGCTSLIDVIIEVKVEDDVPEAETPSDETKPAEDDLPIEDGKTVEDYEQISIAEDAFEGCKDLKKIKIHKKQDHKPQKPQRPDDTTAVVTEKEEDTTEIVDTTVFVTSDGTGTDADTSYIPVESGTVATEPITTVPTTTVPVTTPDTTPGTAPVETTVPVTAKPVDTTAPVTAPVTSAPATVKPVDTTAPNVERPTGPSITEHDQWTGRIVHFDDGTNFTLGTYVATKDTFTFTISYKGKPIRSIEKVEIQSNPGVLDIKYEGTTPTIRPLSEVKACII